MELNRFNINKINGFNTLVFDEKDIIVKEMIYYYKLVPIETRIRVYDEPIKYKNPRNNSLINKLNKNMDDESHTNDLMILKKFNYYNDKNKYEGLLKMMSQNIEEWKTIFMIQLSYPLKVYNSLKYLLNFVFISKKINYAREIIYQTHAGMIPSYDIFNKLLDKYDYLVIDNGIKSEKWQDCVFYYEINVKTPTYNYPKIADIRDKLNKEYLRYYWHPSRIEKWDWELEDDNSA
jgi:hypothetical protein